MEGLQPVTTQEGLKVISMALFLHRPHTPISWRGPIKHGVLKQFLFEAHWGDLQYLIIDLPPGTGEEVLSITQMLRGGAGALVVSTLQALSVLEAKRFSLLCHRLKIKVMGRVDNMVMAHHGGIPDLDIPSFGQIPFDPRMAQGGPFLLHFPRTNTARRLKEVAQRCRKALDERGEEHLVLTAQILLQGERR